MQYSARHIHTVGMRNNVYSPDKLPCTVHGLYQMSRHPDGPEARQQRCTMPSQWLLTPRLWCQTAKQYPGWKPLQAAPWSATRKHYVPFHCWCKPAELGRKFEMNRFFSLAVPGPRHICNPGLGQMRNIVCMCPGLSIGSTRRLQLV